MVTDANRVLAGEGRDSISTRGGCWSQIRRLLCGENSEETPAGDTAATDSLYEWLCSHLSWYSGPGEVACFTMVMPPVPPEPGKNRVSRISSV